MKHVLMAAVAGLLLAGCGGSDGNGAAGPKTFEVQGTMTLTDSGVIGDGGDGCLGSGGYEDLRAGAAVVVFDDADKKIGIGELEAGQASATVRCVFKFSISGVPVRGKIYSVEVSHRGEVPFKLADAKNLALTLG